MPSAFLSKFGRPLVLRTHLILLVLAAMLPLLLLAAFVVRRDVQLQRDAVERGMRDTTRALSLAVDREVGSILAVGQTLAASPYVDSSDFKAFYDLSSTAANTHKGSWVALFGRTGQMIINSREPFGASLPNPLREGREIPDGKTEGLPSGNQAIKTVLETGRPVFSDLFFGLVSKRPTLSVTVPVTRDGKVTYAVSISIASDHLTSLLREQGLPAGWFGVLVDKKGIIIARTAAPEKLVDRPSLAPLIKHLSQADEGWDSGRVQEGIPIYYSYARSKLTGWGIAIGAPQATIDAPVNRSIRIMAGGAALLLLVAIGAALAFGRRISIPISRLAQSAEAIQRGLPIELQGSTVAEVRSLHQALLHAGATARAAAEERELRIAAEAKRTEADGAREKIFTSEGRLRESEERLRLALSVSRTITWTSNLRTGAIVHADNVEVMGLPANANMSAWWQTVHPDDRESLRKIMNGAIAERGNYQADFRIIRPDNRSVLWLHSRGRVECDGFGEPQRIIGTATDITERKHAEEALREVDRRKDDFLAVLGHELRNPLGVINTVVQLLRMEGPLDPKLEEYRETIEQEVQQMRRLLDDLLDVSRIRRGLIQLKMAPCDLGRIVRQVAESRRPILEESGLNLSLRLPEPSLYVAGDTTRLAQIVGNLLDNANKFSNRDGQVSVTVTEEADSRSVILKIRDNGIGIEPEMLARVFEPFVQSEKSLNHSSTGLGLGLALIKGLVELHGGEVWSSSDGPGRGSEFTVRLPLIDVPVAVVTSKELPAKASQCRRILVIEDNLAAAQSLKTFLAKTGHTVEVALSGSSAVVAALKFAPEVVLCDIGLPGLDGYAVARSLREHPKLKPVYLIAMSGYGQEYDQRRALEAGFDKYLTKPIDLSELERLFDGLGVGRQAASA
jgi:PAS domain S-box-containing protein